MLVNTFLVRVHEILKDLVVQKYKSLCHIGGKIQIDTKGDFFKCHFSSKQKCRNTNVIL
jgi:hypothetical protein